MLDIAFWLVVACVLLFAYDTRNQQRHDIAEQNQRNLFWETINEARSEGSVD